MAAKYTRFDAANGASPLTAFGFNATGGGHSDAVDLGETATVGGVYLLHGQVIEHTGSVDFVPTTTTALPVYRKPTTGYPLSAMTPYSVGTVDEHGVLAVYQGCKTRSLQLSIEANGILTASLDWQGLTKVDTGTPGSPAAPTGTVWRWYQSVVTIGGASYRCQSLNATLATDIEGEFDLDGENLADHKREYDRLTEYAERVSCEVSLRKPIPIATRGNTADDPLQNIAVSSVFTSGANSLTLSLAGLANSAGNGDIVTEGPSGYSYSFRAVPNTEAAWTLTYA